MNNFPLCLLQYSWACSYKRAALAKSASFSFYWHLTPGFRVQSRCPLYFRKLEETLKAGCSATLLHPYFSQVSRVRDHEGQERRDGRSKQDWREWSLSIPLHSSMYLVNSSGLDMFQLKSVNHMWFYSYKTNHLARQHARNQKRWLMRHLPVG